MVAVVVKFLLPPQLWDIMLPVVIITPFVGMARAWAIACFLAGHPRICSLLVRVRFIFHVNESVHGFCMRTKSEYVRPLHELSFCTNLYYSSTVNFTSMRAADRLCGIYEDR